MFRGIRNRVTFSSKRYNDNFVHDKKLQLGELIRIGKRHWVCIEDGLVRPDVVVRQKLSTAG